MSNLKKIYPSNLKHKNLSINSYKLHFQKRNNKIYDKIITTINDIIFLLRLNVMNEYHTTHMYKKIK